MQNQYANMVGNICLDKSLPNEETGKGSPITFEIWKVYNGSFFPGHNSRDRRLSGNFETVAQAQKELHQLFEMEMSEHGYQFRIEGEFDGYEDDEGTPERFAGESGWYDFENWGESPDYPESDYPSESAEWVEKQMTGYNYDNYSVVITTSNRDIVSL